jgi:putative chitinase
MNLSADVIAKSTGANIENARKFEPYLNRYMRKYGINTPSRVMAFLSQIGVESARLSTTEEFASGQAYEGRSDLGNIYAGDGQKFKGRGLIQITGRANYEAVKNNFGWDVINNPNLLLEPSKATEVSAWWWSNRKRSGKYLNEWADQLNPKDSIYVGNNSEIFEQITRGVNGGINGLNERKAFFEDSQSVYSDIYRQIQQWFTKWWGIGLIAISIGFGVTILIKNLKN